MKKLIIITLCTCIFMVLVVGKIQQMKAMNSFTKQLINDGYHPRIARHIVEVRYFVRPVDNLYITHDED